MSTENENIEEMKDVNPLVTESIVTKDESNSKSKTKSKKRKKSGTKIEAVVEHEDKSVVHSAQFKQTEVKTMQGRPRSNYKKTQELQTKGYKNTNIVNRNNSFDFS